MRVLQIIPTFDQAGAEKQFSLLCCNLPGDEFEVHACALTRTGPYEEMLRAHNVPVTIIGKRAKIDPFAYWHLRQLITRLKPDVVQTWLFAANSYGRAAAVSCRVPVVIGSEQCADPWKRWFELAIDRRLARRSARIVVNGTGVRDFYLRAGIAADKFVLIPNGIEPHPKSPLSRTELLNQLKLPPQSRLVATIARLWPQKRVRDIIWAAELLTIARDDVHVLIIGDGPERAALERFRDQVQLQDRVHFLGHRNDVVQIIEHLDALWLASGFEGLPNVIMEAMAAGVPVVATNIPGNRDLVVPEKTGYLIPVGDRSALAGWTHQLLENPDRARAMGAAGRQEMIDKYPIANMVDQHAALYRELLW
jgi:glycosyltransferase involved in cell wall biosynthesis